MLFLSTRLDKGSRNSNNPPSNDEFVKPQSQRKISGKKTGGQKSHRGHTLKMSDNPDRTITHCQEQCNDCDDGLSLDLPGKLERRQVFETPKPFL